MTSQIFPPSITGKGGRYAEGGSVLDHAFGKSDPYTLGVEEEYMLLDEDTFDLVQHVDTVLAAVSGHELETQINAEDWEGVGRAHAEIFRDVRPVSSMLVVPRIIDPRWLVEIEADALLPEE